MPNSLDPTPPVHLNARSDLASSIFHRISVSSSDIEASGISQPRYINIALNLSSILRGTNGELWNVLSVIFEDASDIEGFLEVLSDEGTPLLGRLLSLELLRHLSLGQLSPVRLSPIASTSMTRSQVFAIIACVLDKDCQVTRQAPASWMAAFQALMSGGDRKEIYDTFFDELGVDVSDTRRLPKLMHVWSQGNKDVVSITQSLSGTDFFEIIETALSIDGIDDFPAYEFSGMKDCMQAVLADTGHGTPLEGVVRTVLILLAKLVEKAAESVHKNDSTNVVTIDLTGFTPTLLDHLHRIDAANCVVALEGRVSSKSEQLLMAKLSPGWWRIRVSAAVMGTAATVTVSPTETPEPGDVQLWAVHSLGMDGSEAECKESHGTFTFSVDPDEFSTVNPDGECVSIVLRLNDSVPVSVRWTDPHWQTRRNTTVPVIDISLLSSGYSSSRVSPIGSKRESPFPDSSTTVQILPTEIHLPISSSFMRGSMPTIPMLPNPKVVLCLLGSESNGAVVRAMFRHDLVTLMDVNALSVRDVLREVPLADTVVVDEQLFSTQHQFVAGLVVASTNQQIRLLAGSSAADPTSANPLIQQLIQQHVLRPVN